jgi:uncharacterized phiE125 gp8 family phage protein
MNIKILNLPTEKPYSLADIKQYLRVLDTHQDEQITAIADAYLLQAQEITNLVLQGLTTYQWRVDGGFRDLILPKNPIVEVEKIEYIDAEDVVQNLDLANIYLSYPLDATKAPCKLCFEEGLPLAKEIIVTFRAGFVNIDSRVNMWLKSKIVEEYDGLADSERSRYTNNMLDSLRVIPL